MKDQNWVSLTNDDVIEHFASSPIEQLMQNQTSRPTQLSSIYASEPNFQFTRAADLNRDQSESAMGQEQTLTQLI